METTVPNTNKLYTLKAIRLATFLGSPLVAGYLIGQNFKALGATEKATKAVIIGAVSTILILAVVYTIPFYIIEKMPSFIIPLIYMLIAEVIVKKHQGAALEAHAENGGSFYSVWRAVGIGLAGCVLVLGGLFAYFYLEGTDDGYDVYKEQFDKFSKNEAATLEFYNHLQNNSSGTSLLAEIETTDIPKWQENIAIVKGIDTIKNLSEDLKRHSRLLLEYSELRLQAFELFKKAIKEDTDTYDTELSAIHDKINTTLDKINE